MSIPQFIGNQVGKERNTMSIVKWFIEKAKQLVQSRRNRKWNKRVEKEYTNLLNDPNLTEEKYRQWCLGLTDEDLRQEAFEKERAQASRQHPEL